MGPLRILLLLALVGYASAFINLYRFFGFDEPEPPKRSYRKGHRSKRQPLVLFSYKYKPRALLEDILQSNQDFDDSQTSQYPFRNPAIENRMKERFIVRRNQGFNVEPYRPQSYYLRRPAIVPMNHFVQRFPSSPYTYGQIEHQRYPSGIYEEIEHERPHRPNRPHRERLPPCRIEYVLIDKDTRILRRPPSRSIYRKAGTKGGKIRKIKQQGRIEFDDEEDLFEEEEREEKRRKKERKKIVDSAHKEMLAEIMGKGSGKGKTKSSSGQQDDEEQDDAESSEEDDYEPTMAELFPIPGQHTITGGLKERWQKRAQKNKGRDPVSDADDDFIF